MKNIILIFLFAFIGICYAAPPDVAPIPKDNYAICVNVFEPVFCPVTIQVQNFEIAGIQKPILLTYLYGYSFYKFGFKEKYLSQSEKKVPFISRYFREVNSDIFIVQKT